MQIQTIHVVPQMLFLAVNPDTKEKLNTVQVKFSDDTLRHIQVRPFKDRIEFAISSLLAGLHANGVNILDAYVYCIRLVGHPTFYGVVVSATEIVEVISAAIKPLPPAEFSDDALLADEDGLAIIEGEAVKMPDVPAAAVAPDLTPAAPLV